MRRYTITKQEVHVATYEVEANSADEALESIAAGEIDVQDVEFSHVDETAGCLYEGKSRKGVRSIASYPIKDQVKA